MLADEVEMSARGMMTWRYNILGRMPRLLCILLSEGFLRHFNSYREKRGLILSLFILLLTALRWSFSCGFFLFFFFFFFCCSAVSLGLLPCIYEKNSQDVNDCGSR